MIERARNYLTNIESKYPHWYGQETRRTITAYALYVRNAEKIHRRAEELVGQARRLAAAAAAVEPLRPLALALDPDAGDVALVGGRWVKPGERVGAVEAGDVVLVAVLAGGVRLRVGDVEVTCKLAE